MTALIFLPPVCVESVFIVREPAIITVTACFAAHNGTTELILRITLTLITLAASFRSAGTLVFTLTLGLSIDGTCTLLGLLFGLLGVYCFFRLPGLRKLGLVVRVLALVTEFALAAVPELIADVLLAGLTGGDACRFVFVAVAASLSAGIAAPSLTLIRTSIRERNQRLATLFEGLQLQTHLMTLLPRRDTATD